MGDFGPWLPTQPTHHVFCAPRLQVFPTTMPRHGSTRSMGLDDMSMSVATASSGGRNGPKHMDLKGEGSLSAVGKCVSVLYDEGGPELVAYRGVVVYLEPHR